MDIRLSLRAIVVICAVLLSLSVLSPIAAEPLHGAVEVSAGGSHSCALLGDSSVACWGQNNDGQLGSGDIVDRSTPTAVYSSSTRTKLKGIVEISASNLFTCALHYMGTVFCWGLGTYGNLGNGYDNEIVPYPTPVAMSDPALEIAVGGAHACALIGNVAHTVRCWGNNSQGQLGDGTKNSHFAPVDVVVTELSGHQTPLSGVVHIVAGATHTCAILSDSSVACWGGNVDGQLGNGTKIDGVSPTTVVITQSDGSQSVLSGIGQISAGTEHTCAVFPASFSAACWGSNYKGQLGVPDAPTTATSPIGIPSLSVGTISSGGFHTCAVLADNELACWGKNDSGQLGNGTNTDSDVETLVSIRTATQVSAGYYHSCAVLPDTTIRCWGWGQYGQLGNGTTSNVSTPVTVDVGLIDDEIFDGSFEPQG